MTDETFFRSPNVKKFHFYRLIVETSFDMVFDGGASVCDAVISGEYAVDPFRVHVIPLQTGRADNLY